MTTQLVDDAPAPALDGGGERSLISHLGGLSARLRQRRFELLPLIGPGTPGTDVQGRAPGPSTMPKNLADLISSVSEIGFLQPILAEEIPRPDGPPRLLVTVGERRLRAGRWGAVNLPDNPHFRSIPAIVCPGPLSEEERRIWQLVENLAREPLSAGDQAAALLFHRCAVLVGKLLHAGRPVPTSIYAIENPGARFRALELLRGGDRRCAAPWAEVLDRLGLQMSPRKARVLVSAFAALPADLVEEMDEQRIALHTRIKFIGLRRDQAAAADEIWAALRTQGRPDLLGAAVDAAGQGLPAADAIAAALDRREQANQSRAEKLRHDLPSPAATSPTSATPEAPTVATPAATGQPAATDPAVVAVVAGALSALRALAQTLRAGTRPDRFDASSLRLLADELLRLLPLENGA